jgi:hypothetical protein
VGSSQNKHLPLEAGTPEIRPFKAEGRLFLERPAPMALPCIKFILFYKVPMESRVIRKVPQLRVRMVSFRIRGNETKLGMKILQNEITETQTSFSSGFWQ